MLIGNAFHPARLGLTLATIGVGIAALPSATVAQEAFIGEIRMVGFGYCPRDWLEAAGQELPIRENEAPFSLLGTTYGGDGRTTFTLPDLRQDGRGKGKPRADTVRHRIAVAGFYLTRP